MHILRCVQGCPSLWLPLAPRDVLKIPMQTVVTETRKVPAQTGDSGARHIRRVAVLGAGIMGSRIALHFANIGVEALLLDVLPRELSEADRKAGLTEDSPKWRNGVVNRLFQEALKSSPSPTYGQATAGRVTLGNLTDDLNRVAEADWIIEVVVERLDIKQQVYERLEQYRRPGTLITTNTSGIPMHMLAQGRSEDFRRHFCGTHFFNPPRYLELLEVIPAPDTDPAVVRFLMHYGDLHLGKRTVLCKDTPAFIANRIGIYAICHLFQLTEKYGLTVEEVDKLTGPLIGHPKSATFRTCDLVGLDTAAKVARGIQENCPQDEARDVFSLPEYVQWMVANEYWGDKSGKGFYRKEKQGGKTEILSLNLKGKAYAPQQKPSSPTLAALKPVDRVEDRLKLIMQGQDPHARFLQEFFWGVFAYVSHRIPEVADHLYQIDDGIKAGFGWGLGAFEKWDLLGVERQLKAAEAAGYKIAPWVSEMLAAGHTHFYQIQGGARTYYDIAHKSHQPIPGTEQFLILDTLRHSRVLWGNAGCSIFDLGEGILGVEFHSKMNTLGSEVLSGIHRALDKAESEGYNGVVIGNQGEQFSAGANLALVLMMAIEQEWDELNYAIQYFQKTTMRVRYSDVPVVVTPHGLTLGGGCEMTLHADAVQAHAETYIGLVEVGVGLIPGGGGTKEFALRLADEYRNGDIELNAFSDYLLTIAQAKVATSAEEAYDLRILRRGQDYYSLNKRRQLADARQRCLGLAQQGYRRPSERQDVRVLGRNGLGAAYAAIYQMQYAGYATEHDATVARKVAYVLCGGDLSEPQNVSEQYLLNLEREAFLSLLGERKTLERIQHMLKTGKPLRN